MNKDFRPNNKNSLLLVTDVQEKLFNPMLHREDLKNNLIKLINAFKILEIPVVFLEQNPKSLGPTISHVFNEAEDSKVFKKMTFGIGENPEFYSFLEDMKIINIYICGIETHVCVFQCARDLMEKGYKIHILSDAVSSRKEKDYFTGIKRIEYEGGIPSSAETAIFELLYTCKREKFKPILKLVK